MAKSVSSKDIELHTDAWERFERAVGVVAKTPPQHRVKPSNPLKSMTPKRDKPQPKTSKKPHRPAE
jgi:hypothetical protein